MSFCRICLQPATPRTVDLDATLDAFYDELVYYDVIQHWALSVCIYCEHLLRKAYNIRQRCRRAHILLKSWSKDTEKKVSLNFLWKLLPKNSITIVNNQAVQKLFAYVDKKPDTGCETTIDNAELATLIPIHYKQEPKKDIKTYYQEFLNDAELKLNEDDENNTNKFNTVNENNENTDPNKASDNESDDVFEDNFEDFFRSEVKLNDVETKETELKESKKKIRKERTLTKRRAISRAVLEKLIKEGVLQDLELDTQTMLNWFDRTPMYTLRLKGILNPKYHRVLDKWRQLFGFLKRRYNSKYMTVFDIEILETHEQKVAEFVARQHSEQFINAPCKCFICFKILPRRGLTEYHRKVYHDESLPEKCDICLCGFQNKRKLKKHMYGNHEIVYRCKICPYVTRNREIMTIHYEEHGNNGIFCDMCGKQFRKVKTMTKHMLSHKRDAFCPFCGGCFASTGLIVHVRCKHKDDPLYEAQPTLPCAECGAAFHYEAALNIHIQRDHKEYKCSCGEVFLDDMSLTMHTRETKHIRIKSEIKTEMSYVRCDVCAIDVPYTSPFALRSHYRTAHPAVPYVSRDKRKNVVLCETCGLACMVGPDYEDHLNTHSGEKPYECSECGARFATRLTAEHHLKIHTKNKEKVMKSAGAKHKCHVCEKEFGNSYYLRRHMRIHEDFNRVVVTSRVVMPQFVKPYAEANKQEVEVEDITKKPNTLNKICLQNKERNTTNDASTVKNESSSVNYGSECMESDESLHGEETSIKHDGTKGSEFMESDESLHNEEISMKNDGSQGSECMESDESLRGEETCDNFNNEQCRLPPAPGMEVIFDFENEFVEEVIL